MPAPWLRSVIFQRLRHRQCGNVREEQERNAGPARCNVAPVPYNEISTLAMLNAVHKRAREAYQGQRCPFDNQMTCERMMQQSDRHDMRHEFKIVEKITCSGICVNDSRDLPAIMAISPRMLVNESTRNVRNNASATKIGNMIKAVSHCNNNTCNYNHCRKSTSCCQPQGRKTQKSSLKSKSDRKKFTRKEVMDSQFRAR
jgi:hypothetical protein